MLQSLTCNKKPHAIKFQCRKYEEEQKKTGKSLVYTRVSETKRISPVEEKQKRKTKQNKNEHTPPHKKAKHTNKQKPNKQKNTTKKQYVYSGSLLWSQNAAPVFSS